mgnify:CR=1 FL=1
MEGSYDFLIGMLLVFGALFAFFPKAMIRLNQIGNTVLFRDEQILKHPKALGAVMVLIGLIILVNLLLMQ